MNVRDRIYGKITIDDPVVLKIIATSPFQRLKHVNQYGGVNFVYPDKYQVSRYEHSIGVYHVLKTLGASFEVQIAGLLHDIGHCAFSHMVDHAMASTFEDYHEQNRHLIKDIFEIDAILADNKLIPKNVDDYGEIKKPLPNVGADRIDYAVRDYVGATGKHKDLGNTVLENIKLVGDQIVFTNKDAAKDYALTGLEAMWLVIYEPSVAVVYDAITEIIRQGALQEKWIKEDQLFLNDVELMHIIMEHKDLIPEKRIKIFTTKFKVLTGTAQDHDFHHIKLKARFFDPFVDMGDKQEKLSTIDQDFKTKLDEMIAIFEKRKTGAYYKVEFLES